jgi:hypothetical protein
MHPACWKTNAYPAAGAEPQAIINRQIVDSADFVVGIFWTRFGIATSTAGSGTEEEIERSIAAGKHTMVYFSDAPIAPSAFDADEYAKVAAFKEKHSHRGLYSTYRDLTEFREEFRTHFALLMNDVGGASGTGPIDPEPTNSEATIPMSFAPAYWVVILAAVQMAMKSSLNRLDELRSQGVKPDEISEAETTALVAPIMIRSFIIDVLAKHGVIKPEAGAKVGYSALMTAVDYAGGERGSKDPLANG